jgi:hypothetical protein
MIRAVVTSWWFSHGLAAIEGAKGADDFSIDRDDMVDRRAPIDVGSVIRCELKRGAGRTMVGRHIEVLK